jgi:hypothetical protein
MDLNLYTVDEIKLLIKAGILSEQEVVDFYGKDWCKS